MISVARGTAIAVFVVSGLLTGCSHPTASANTRAAQRGFGIPSGRSIRALNLLKRTCSSASSMGRDGNTLDFRCATYQLEHPELDILR